MLEGEDRYANQEFVAPYDTLGLMSAMKHLRTDASTVDVLGSQLIQSATAVESGSEVVVPWDVPQGTHAWFARATEPHGESVASPRIGSSSARLRPTPPTPQTPPTR